MAKTEKEKQVTQAIVFRKAFRKRAGAGTALASNPSPTTLQKFRPTGKRNWKTGALWIDFTSSFSQFAIQFPFFFFLLFFFCVSIFFPPLFLLEALFSFFFFLLDIILFSSFFLFHLIPLFTFVRIFIFNQGISEVLFFLVSVIFREPEYSEKISYEENKKNWKSKKMAYTQIPKSSNKIFARIFFDEDR